MEKKLCLLFAVIYFALINIKCLAQAEILKATDFVSISQSATCENDMYGVFTLSSLDQKSVSNLTYLKIRIISPSGYEIESFQPYLTKEEKWEDNFNKAIIEFTIGIISIPVEPLGFSLTMLDGLKAILLFMDKHKNEPIKEVSVTFNSTLGITKFKQSYLIHFSSITMQSRSTIFIPIKIEYQTRGQTSGTLNYQDGSLTLCNNFNGAIDNPFKITLNPYSENDNLELAVYNEFGKGYRIADWNDVVEYCKKYSTDQLINNLNIQVGESIGIVKWNNQNFWNQSKRHFFLSRFDHNTPRNYLSHANIDNHHLDLGSWFGLKMPILCIRK